MSSVLSCRVSHGSSATMPGGSEAAQAAISGRTRTRLAAIQGWPSSPCRGPNWRRFHCCQRWPRWPRAAPGYGPAARGRRARGCRPPGIRCGRPGGRVLPFGPELLTGPGTGNSGPALHQAVPLETAGHGIEARACHPDCAPPHGPDPALHASGSAIHIAGSNQSPISSRTSRPVAATRSPSPTTSPPASTWPGNHAEPETGTGVQNARFSRLSGCTTRSRCRAVALSATQPG